MAQALRRPQEACVAVGEHAISYRFAGDGPPLVLLHGFLCDSRVWERQLTALSDRFRVIAWDAPGAGTSSDPPDSFTLADWAHCLAGFLDAIGIERAHILGLSWGGVLAQELFRLHPGRALGLVLADTYAGWKGSLPADACEERLARCLREASLPADEFVKRWVPAQFFTDEVEPEVEEAMIAIVSDFHPLGFTLMARSLAETDTTTVLPTIDVPVLLLWGEHDQRSPPAIGRQFVETVPNSQLVVLPNAGHVSNMEQPGVFNARVREFLVSVSA
jgi:pimeloyl-ACP methyl ester carboxylesterase